MAETVYKMTTDHSLIKTWVEKRGGFPVSLKGKQTPGVNDGVIAIAFSDTDMDKMTMQRINWAEFFTLFDQAHLAFQYTDSSAPGMGHFFKFISCDGE